MKKLSVLIILFTLFSCAKETHSSDDCIDQEAINPNAICYGLYEPVCGCDGVTYSNDCVAKSNGVKSYTSGACNCTYPYQGVVKKLDTVKDCNLMIELSEGTLIEAVKLPPEISLVEGSMVSFNYREITAHPSACKGGVMADIFCIRQSSCLSITHEVDGPPMIDKVDIHKAFIINNCLTIQFSHGGGCEVHDLELRNLIPFCGMPPLPPTTLQFVHEANGDRCEALIHGEMSFDMKPFQIPGKSSIPIVLIDYHGEFSQNLTYNY